MLRVSVYSFLKHPAGPIPLLATIQTDHKELIYAFDPISRVVNRTLKEGEGEVCIYAYFRKEERCGQHE
jgi:hypothetical protein